jgi:PAS domain S-box-containing protein
MQPFDVLKLCFEMSPDPVGVLDQSGAFAAVNPRFAALLGSEPQALVGVSPTRFIDEEARPLFEDTLRQSADVDSVAEASLPCLKADGQRVLLSLKLRGCEGGLRTVSLRQRSVDTRAREEEAADREIKGRDRLLRAMLDNIQLFVMEVRADGTVVRCEGKALATLGWSPEAIVGRSAFEAPAISEDLRTELRLALEGSVRQGTIGWGKNAFDTWLIPTLDDAGRVSSVICVLADQTARVLSEREARRNLQTIERQKTALQAMALPVLEVWEGVIALPIIGALDSQRAAELMEITLDRIVARSARFAILDLTGVETMDTATANHLIKVVQAAGLLGARALITGIRPSIAQILVHLGADLSRVVTLRTLREGLRYCADREDEDDEDLDPMADGAAAPVRDDGPIIP